MVMRRPSLDLAQIFAGLDRETHAGCCAHHPAILDNHAIEQIAPLIMIDFADTTPFNSRT